MRVHGSTRSALSAALLLATALNACTSWRVEPLSPEQLLKQEQPTAIRVERKNGTRVVLDSPQLGPDSLLGTTSGRHTGVPLADISHLAVRHGDALKSVSLTVGLLALTFVAVITVVCVAEHCNELGS